MCGAGGWGGKGEEEEEAGDEGEEEKEEVEEGRWTGRGRMAAPTFAASGRKPRRPGPAWTLGRRGLIAVCLLRWLFSCLPPVF